MNNIKRIFYYYLDSIINKLSDNNNNRGRYGA